MPRIGEWGPLEWFKKGGELSLKLGDVGRPVGFGDDLYFPRIPMLCFFWS